MPHTSSIDLTPPPESIVERAAFCGSKPSSMVLKQSAKPAPCVIMASTNDTTMSIAIAHLTLTLQNGRTIIKIAGIRPSHESLNSSPSCKSTCESVLCMG